MIESSLTDKILKLYKKYKGKNTHDKECEYTCPCLLVTFYNSSKHFLYT